MTKTILVVDDESSIRDALSKVLHAEDYEVVCAKNRTSGFRYVSCDHEIFR